MYCRHTMFSMQFVYIDLCACNRLGRRLRHVCYNSNENHGAFDAFFLTTGLFCKYSHYTEMYLGPDGTWFKNKVLKSDRFRFTGPFCCLQFDPRFTVSSPIFVKVTIFTWFWGFVCELCMFYCIALCHRPLCW